jgi:ADP-ribosylglycohydrolase
MFATELPPHENKISELALFLYELQKSGTLYRESPEELSLRFGGGTKAAFSAYNSFGLSYAMFVRKPDSFEAVYDVIAAGGDTDSNASIVGSLLGALNGEKVIPSDLVGQVERSEWIRERTRIFFEVCVNKKGGMA